MKTKLSKNFSGNWMENGKPITKKMFFSTQSESSKSQVASRKREQVVPDTLEGNYLDNQRLEHAGQAKEHELIKKLRKL